MYESVVTFVTHYGYLAVFLGSLVEGETIILTASAFAATGLLRIEYIWLISFSGTLFADQVLFYLGSHYSDYFTFLSVAKKDQFKKILNAYPKSFILSFRFIYGIRTISPIIIGMLHFPPVKFTFLNVISAFLWATISCGFGFLLGHQTHEHYYFFSIITLILYLAMIFYMHKRINLLE